MNLTTDQSMFDYPSLRPNTTAWIVYCRSAPLPAAKLVDQFTAFDDINLVPLKPMRVAHYDKLITADVNFATINGINFATINGQTYSPANVPTLFSALTLGNRALDPREYGSTTNTFVLNYLDEVRIAINNLDKGNHPCIPFILNVLT